MTDFEARRFVLWSAPVRFAVLGLILSAILGAVITIGPLHDYANGRSSQDTDAGLYRGVIDRVRQGEGFYPATVREQIERGYPVRPAMTVREPSLTWFEVAVGGWRNAIYPMVVLAVVTGLAMIRRLEAIDNRRRFFLFSGLGALFALGPFVGPIQVTQHECWAGLLLVLSLAVRTSRRFALAIFFALIACLFRELAAPFLALMTVAAMTERRPREAGCWIVAGIAFGAVYAVHLWAVGRETVFGDPHSPGWFAHGGLTHVLETVRLTTFAGAGPDVLSILLLVFGLSGWASIRGPFANRVLGWMAFWVVATMIVGRPENVVWGFIWTGPLVLGVVLLPGAIRDLVFGNQTAQRSSDRE